MERNGSHRSRNPTRKVSNTASTLAKRQCRAAVAYPNDARVGPQKAKRSLTPQPASAAVDYRQSASAGGCQPGRCEDQGGNQIEAPFASSVWGHERAYVWKGIDCTSWSNCPGLLGQNMVLFLAPCIRTHFEHRCPRLSSTIRAHSFRCNSTGTAKEFQNVENGTSTQEHLLVSV